MSATAIMTVRIDPELLKALKERASRQGRSVSAEVVRLIRSEVGDVPCRAGRPGPTMGMFEELEAPELDDFLQARREASRLFRVPRVKARKRS